MITDIPNASGFRQAGIDHINLAADQVFSLFGEFDRSGPTDEHEIAMFWSAAQRPLSNALTLVEQGTNFLLKSRIAEVTPFLLISGAVRDWPRGSTGRNVAFAEFRTHDAQDLVRIHDTVAPTRLSKKFVEQLGKLRRRRNTIMHTVDPSLEVTTANEILRLGLDGVHELVGADCWVDMRRDYLHQTPSGAASGDLWVETQLLQDVKVLLSVLTKGQLHRYFGVVKNQRAYRCPVCFARDASGDVEVRTAQLSPNTPHSTNVHCFVCDEDTEVERKNCTEAACKGNVLGMEGMCLTCFSER